MIKEYENNTLNDEVKNTELYSINEIIGLYPLLSKHIITNAINEGNLKVTWIGNKRYFNLDDVDAYLKSKNDKYSSEITNKLESWRTK